MVSYDMKKTKRDSYVTSMITKNNNNNNCIFIQVHLNLRIYYHKRYPTDSESVLEQYVILDRAISDKVVIYEIM
jgi:hypothetical protein